MTESAGLGIPDLTNERPIGRGGFSVVYVATDTRFDRQVAVKVLNPLTDDRDRRRFETECRVMGRVSGHPNVVTVFHAAFLADDRPYLIMELVEGGSLADRLEEGPMPWAQACEVMAQIAAALDHAHRSQVLHRDIKPANILLDSGARGTPKLTDFGIASLGGATVSRTSTEISATWLHTAPETFNNQRDERSDIYSMASTLYELIAGRAPHYRATDTQIEPLLARLMMEPAAPLTPGLAPASIEEFLARNLAKNPDHRSQTAAAFGAELQHLVTAAATPGSTTRAGVPPPGTAPNQVAPPPPAGHQPPSPSMPGRAAEVAPTVAGAQPASFVPAPSQQASANQAPPSPPVPGQQPVQPAPQPPPVPNQPGYPAPPAKKVSVGLIAVVSLVLLGALGIGLIVGAGLLRNDNGGDDGDDSAIERSDDVSTDSDEVDGETTLDPGPSSTTTPTSSVDNGDENLDPSARPADDSDCPVPAAAVSVAPPTAADVTDTIGCPRFERIFTSIGQSHSYVLALTAGDQVSMFLDTGCSGISYTVSGPRGDEISSEPGACLDAALIVAAATDGEHLIRIESIDEQSAYSLRLLDVGGISRQTAGEVVDSNCPADVPVPVLQPAELDLFFDENDCPARGAELEVFGQRDRFELNLRRGDRISINLDTGCSGVAIEITGPDGTVLEQTGSCLAFSELVEIESDGDYFFDIISVDTFSNYELMLLDVTA